MNDIWKLVISVVGIVVSFLIWVLIIERIERSKRK